MFEVTGEEIQELNDDDLRTLIALLCESEVQERGGSPRSVTYGGDQNAPDGGIDVRVDSEIDLDGIGFILSKYTGIQVKKPDMPRGEILKEMRPNGILRDSIKELIDKSGSYIIVSSGSSTSDIALKNRIEAMKEAIKSESGSENLLVDFYDKTRIASWVMQYPSILLWVKSKIGRSHKGWRSYENWSNPKGGLEEQYLIDEGLKIVFPQESNSDTISVLEGIERLIRIVRNPRESVRIAGLSGVGKTRFVQALFDDRIVENCLERNKVFYTDIGYDPDPNPIEFARRLINADTSGVLVVDNCKPSLHRLLTQECKSARSQLSLITVEYDVKDDIQEETHVVRIKPSSVDLISKLVLNRYPQVGQLNATKIAEFSDGNARIALVLGSTLGDGDSIGSLRDNELLNRLILQGSGQDDSLIEAAEVLSIVYSFSIEIKPDGDELDTLSAISGLDKFKLFKLIVELERREIIQSRSSWRALLPHALSNRLAERAIENYPVQNITKELFKPECERLLISFSRRLGYLHTNTVAKNLVEAWFSKEGFLNEIEAFDNTKITVFENIAPVNPVGVLKQLEKINDRSFFSKDNKYHLRYTSLVFKISFSPELFERALKILFKFAEFENDRNDRNDVNSIINKITHLFHVTLSGTHATIDQRIRIINNYLSSSDKGEFEIGVKLLSAWLKTTNFTSFFSYSFGSKPRDFGYKPATIDEYNEWFSKGMQIVDQFTSLSGEQASLVQNAFVNKFVNLMQNTYVYDEILLTAEKILNTSYKEEIWVKLKFLLKDDHTRLPEEVFEKVSNLVDQFSPNDLVDRVKVYTLSNDRGTLLDEIAEGESYTDKYNRMNKIVYDLGKEVSTDKIAFDEVMPDLLRTSGYGRFWEYGEGLADGATDLYTIWLKIKAIIVEQEETINFLLIKGFVYGANKKDPSFVSLMLEDVLISDEIGNYFPLFQSSIGLDDKGLERVLRSLEIGKCDSWSYRNLSFRKNIDVSDHLIAKFYVEVSKLENGSETAIELMTQQYYNIEKDESLDLTSEIADSINQVVVHTPLKEGHGKQQYDRYGFERVFRRSLKFESGKETARILCERLYELSKDYRIRYGDVEKLLIGIVDARPEIFLDNLVGRFDKEDWFKLSAIINDYGDKIDLLSRIENESLIRWCDEDGIQRYFIVSKSINPIVKLSETEYKWSDVAISLIQNAHDKITVLNNIGSKISPSSWSGSRADITSNRLVLLDQLLVFFDAEEIKDWVILAKEALLKEIEADRAWEAENQQSGYNSFE